jgi:hypothetical protein
MSASLPKRAGRGPPALRIHAGVSRHRASTRGLLAGPWTPLAFLCSAGRGWLELPPSTPNRSSVFVLDTIILVRRGSYE